MTMIKNLLTLIKLLLSNPLGPVSGLHFNPYNAELCLFKPWGLNGVFN